MEWITVQMESKVAFVYLRGSVNHGIDVKPKCVRYYGSVYLELLYLVAFAQLMFVA